jgi:hypothetical protein
MSMGSEMIKQTSTVTALVIVLVAAFVYAISPGEMENACAWADRRICDAWEAMVSIFRRDTRAGGEIGRQPQSELVKKPEARNLSPDPFYPNCDRPLRKAGFTWRSLAQTQVLAAVPVAAAALWLGACLRKRRSQSAAEEKMAGTLSKAVQEMSKLSATTLRTIDDT